MSSLFLDECSSEFSNWMRLGWLEQIQMIVHQCRKAGIELIIGNVKISDGSRGPGSPDLKN